MTRLPIEAFIVQIITHNQFPLQINTPPPLLVFYCLLKMDSSQKRLKTCNPDSKRLLIE